MKEFTAADARISRPVVGFPNYLVTEDGRVWSLVTRRWLSQCVMKRGQYLAVSLWRDGRGSTRYVHLIVAAAFIGPRPKDKRDTAHRDGNKRNNHYTNLRHATRAENEADKVLHGKSNRGERNGHSKITDAIARRIRAVGARRIRGDQKRLAEQYGLTSGAVANIVNGKRWA